DPGPAAPARARLRQPLGDRDCSRAFRAPTRLIPIPGQRTLFLPIKEGEPMAKRHESALRQHRRSLRSQDRNRRNVSRLRSALRTIRELAAGKKKEEVQKLLLPTISLIDHSISTGTVHRNAAARLKSR